MRCYCATVRQVARRLTRFYEAELTQAGINPAQFELLATVQGQPGISQTELAAAMDVDQTTLSRNLKLPIVQGWVTKRTGKRDTRRAEYTLTVAGLAVLRAAFPCWERATRRMEEGLLGVEIWRTLDRLAAAADKSAA